MKRIWIVVIILTLIVVGIAAFALTSKEPTVTSTQVAAVTESTATEPEKPISEPKTSVILEQETKETARADASTLTPTPEPPTPIPTPEPVLPPGIISGKVFDENGPVEGAVVRVRATDIETLSNAEGAFTLRNIKATDLISVTAWVDGYYTSAASVIPGTVPISITIKQYHTTDNPKYDFASAEACGECHQNYAEWQADAHAQSAVNHRFLNMYLGTDVNGNQTELERDLKGLPLPPDPDQSYYGPGFKVDFPERDGNCAACHTPMASKLESKNTCGWSGCHTNVTASRSEQVPYGVSPNHLTDVAAEGITCDFCHKLGDVILDPETNLPYAAKPGISSMKLYRPVDEDHDLFLGTFDDAPGRDSYLPLQEESAFCAPCHFGVFGGVAGGHDVTGGVSIYNSYGEWLVSPYSDPETGQTCQDCHMPTVDYEYAVYADKGGFKRDPNTIHNHTMPGAMDETLLQNSVTMTATSQVEDGAVQVEVSITNDQTGHYVPTGVPLRHMLLVVQATAANGDPLPLIAGPLLPRWAGNYADQPGQYYAKIIKDLWTGETPTGAFWRDIELVEDTRLPAMATDVNQFSFDAPTEGPVTVEATLVFRRAYQELMEQKGWDDPDIVMEHETVEVTIPHN